MFPATGSTITAAILPRCRSKISSTASRSLYAHESVSAVTAAGTPGESGRPRVAAPEPACTSSMSAWPWYPPANFTILSRPVNARARRSALITASVPELTNRISSTLGTRPRTSRASSSSRGLGAPKLVPRDAASASAARMRGCACPRTSGPQERT